MNSNSLRVAYWPGENQMQQNKVLVEDKHISFNLAEDLLLKGRRAAHIHTPIILISEFASKDFAHDLSVYGTST